MHNKPGILVVCGVIMALVGWGRAETLFHWHFDGTVGQELLTDTDTIAAVTVNRFEDADLPGSSSYDVTYGIANPSYNTAGTSADFFNESGNNDPGAGLFALDEGVDTALDLSNLSACTIEAFVRPLEGRQSVIIRKYDSDGAYYIDTRPENKFAVRLAGNGQDIGDSGGVCNDLTYVNDNWYHVALVWNGSVIKFYVNGQQSHDLGPGSLSELPFTGPIGDTDRALGIGCIVRDNVDPPANSGQFFLGSIDEVRISDTALTPAEFLLYGDAELASNPAPENYASGVSPLTDLSWTTGEGALSHDVYFGTDFDDVNNAADPNTLPGRGRQSPNSYDPPGSLTVNTTYYWRIDEVGSGGVIKGYVWSFAVADTFVNSLGMKMIRIPAGSFTMGSESGNFDEVPIRNVTISSGFHMSELEVTNAQYEQFDPGHSLIDHRGFLHGPNEAVIFVSWEDANAFCSWLSDREALPYRLPTEAEWEYACRAGTTTAYYTGDSLPGEYLKHAEETWGPYPVPLDVGQTSPNPWGLYDMHGNIEEWCYDWYGPYDSNDQTDPVGMVDGDFRVSRGGSHSTTVEYLRSANRMGTLPDDKHWLIGFRVVMGALPSTEALPVPGPQPYQIGVSQTVPPDINDGPNPDVPYFEGPRTYVKIAPGSYGPLFSSHNHDPGFTNCPNGDLLAIWYTTTREPARELAVAISRLRYGQDEWEDASPFWDAPDRNDHCPAMWTDEAGKIYQFAGLADAATWGALAIITRTSTDNGVTWSRARIIVPDHTGDHMPVEAVFRTRDGAILLPCDRNPGSHVFLSYDDGWTWTDSGGRIYGIHAGVVQLNDNRLMAFGRGDNIDNKMPQSLSNDMGASWSYSATQFPPISGGQRLILQRLREGPILFVSFTGSAGMSINSQWVYGMFAALSYDEGLTWPVKKLITAGGPAQTLDGGGNTHTFVMDDTHAEPRGYLACIQTPDGVIQLISSALHYKFNLAWLEHTDYLPIDNFETYTDDGGANPLGSTWQDSATDANNGAIISLETDTARDNQSMKVGYNNTWPYCRAARTYSTAQDWTQSDSKALSLWFYGQTSNSAADQMYVLVQDTDGNYATVLYSGDANSIQQQQWQQWHIDLEDFNAASVDLKNIETFAVGVSGTGAGTLYFDDIRLYPTRCVRQFAPAGDIDGDCIVDNADVGLMADNWLEAERVVAGTPPDAAHLLLWYRFDESDGYTVFDSSGDDHDGIIDGPVSGWDPCNGYLGGCRVFADDTDVTVPTDVLSSVDQGITITVWLRDALRPDSDNAVFETGDVDFFLRADVPDTGNNLYWRAGYAATDELWFYCPDIADWAAAWTHYAFVKDAAAGVMRIYRNGSKIAEKPDASTTLAGVHNTTFDIAAIIAHHNDYIGRMDDFRIYDYALSQAEIVGAAAGGGDLFIPLARPEADLYQDGQINFKDLAVLGGSWLQEKLWP